MKIAIVILNWNGKKLLQQFLPSITKYSNLPYVTIYVADNASTDNSISFLKKNYPHINIVKNQKNYGFAKGYNSALKHIKADVYALVNSDVEVTKNWLNPIINIFKTQPNCAAVQPKILDFNKKNKFEYAGAGGGLVDSLGYPFCRGRIFNYLETDTQQFNDEASIFWASGACLFIRSEIYHNLGGFDEDYFAHQEEIDLCWRIKNENYDVKYCGKSTVYHVGGATLKEANPRKTFLNFRNSLFTLAKNIAFPKVIFLIFARLILDGVAGIKFFLELKPIHTWAIIKAHFSFYYFLPKIIGKRKPNKLQGKYYYTKSIVWKHFIRKVNRFSDL